MSRTPKTVRVTIETSEVMIIRRQRRTRRWCSECGVESEFVDSDAIKSLVLGPVPSQPSPNLLSRVHIWKSPDGTVLICVRSLNGVWANSKRNDRSKGDE